MRQLRFSRKAVGDIDGHIRYAESFGATVAERLIRLTEQALVALSTFPFAGVRLGRRRKFPIPGTTLILVYRLREDAVEITRCVDGRTNWTRHVR